MQGKENKLLQRKLHAAMKYAHDVCIIGATNRMVDIKRTNGWSFTQQFRYDYTGKYIRSANEAYKINEARLCNIVYDAEKMACHTRESAWFYYVDDVCRGRFCNTPVQLYQKTELDPLQDRKFHLHSDKISIFLSAIRAESTRSGNCGVQARLVTKYLWEHAEGIKRIEGVAMQTFDHIFVIVNRSGELSRPETWGDAWVIDPWALGGVIYPAKDFLQKLKEIKRAAKSEIDNLFAIGIYASKSEDYPDDHPEDRWCRVYQVKPEVDRYPSYEKRMKFEDYYAYNDNRFNSGKESFSLMSQVIKDKHELKFDDCLREIKALKTNPRWCRFFQQSNNRDVKEILHAAQHRKK